MMIFVFVVWMLALTIIISAIGLIMLDDSLFRLVLSVVIAYHIVHYFQNGH